WRNAAGPRPPYATAIRGDTTSTSVYPAYNPCALHGAHVEEQMRLRFGLLGPLIVSGDDRPIALGSAKQQLLLAALLLRPGEIITTAELELMLWGDEPPASSSANVRTYVRGLRAVLSCDDAEHRILTARGGYLLRVAPGERDLDLFDAVVRRGREALASGDPQ